MKMFRYINENIIDRSYINYKSECSGFIWGFCIAALVYLSMSVPLMAAPMHPILASKKVSSGQTQVIAKVEGREVTLNELRVEINRLNLDPLDPGSERVAMQSLVDRILVVNEAKKSGVAKRPEVLWRIEAAKQRALAEFYMGLIAQPTEPTQTDVEKFMLDNPSLFTKAKRYTFSVLEMGVDDFNVEDFTPLFDETSDFSVLKKYLDGQSIKYTLNQSVRPSSAFPEQIRKQLASYDITDNIVLQGGSQVSILKIMKIVDEGVSLSEGANAARVLLRKENKTEKAYRKIETLRGAAKVKYFRPSVSPDPLNQGGE